MASTNTNAVRFLHFTGTELEWLTRINSNGGSWNDAIVFGYIYDNAIDKNIIAKKIYAGKDSKGMDYIFGGNEGKSIQQIEFNTYSEAEDYINSGEATTGQLILVKTGNNAGSYIVLKTADNNLILQSLDRNQWIYGVGSQWHTADDSTTVDVGGIKAGTKLGDLISETNGELSRIIEKMLFANFAPVIHIDDIETGEDPYTQAVISYSITGTNIVSKKIYCNLSQSTTDPVEVRNLDSMTGTEEFDNLIPGRKYFFGVEVKSIDGTEILEWTNIELPSYDEASAVLNITADNLVPTGNSNLLGMNISDNAFVVTYGDYVAAGETTYKVNGVSKTLEEINAAKDYIYGVNYTIKGEQLVKLPGSTETKMVSVSKTIVKNANECSISISTVNDEPYESKVYEFDDDFTISVTGIPGVYNASVGFKLNDKDEEIQQIIGNQTINKLISGLEEQEDEQELVIRIFDEYSEKSVSLKFNYEAKNETYYITMLTKKSYATYNNETFIDVNGSDQINSEGVFGASEYSGPQTVTALETLVYDDNIEWFEEQSLKGIFKNFFVDANCLTPVDVLNDPNIIIDNVTKDGKCYGYKADKSYTDGAMIALVPAGLGLQVQFYGNSIDNKPGYELISKHTEGHLVYLIDLNNNKVYYDLWYTISNIASEWVKYEADVITWIKIY